MTHFWVGPGDEATKISVLTIKIVRLTMKLERVLTMKIVDNFVCFGMPNLVMYRLAHEKKITGLPQI